MAENVPLWFRNQFRSRKGFVKTDLKPGNEVMCYWDGARYTISDYGPNETAAGYAQRTMDVDHKISKETLRKLKGSADHGSPFYSERFSVTEPTFGSQTKIFGTPNGNWGNRWFEVTGPFYPSAITYNEARRLRTMNGNYTPSPDVTLVPMSVWELQALGATAISKALPTLPDSALATSIGELKDLPSIPLRKFARDPSLSSAGDEFLNYTFGIEPTVKDVIQLQKTSQEMAKKIDQLKRDSGKLIRRRFEISKTEENTSQVFHNQSSYPAEWMGTLTRNRSVSTRVWFSGAFKHSYPTNLDEQRQKLADFDAAYGSIPNAATAWNLSPYSWLVDWFTNVGDVVTNASYLGKNGLHIAYAYIMCETTVRIDDTLVGSYSPGGGTWPISTSCSTVTTVKQRLRATPFGFGVSPIALSAKQGAILTALGLSRSRV
jgi:hypothetical protein